MIERTVRFTVPTTEAILPANLFKVGIAASVAAAAAAPAVIAATAASDGQLALDFARDAAPTTSLLLPTADAAAAHVHVIDITAEDVSDDEFGEIDLGSDPSTDDVIATARRFARVPAE